MEQEGNLRMKTRNKGNLSATSANGQKNNFVRSRQKSNGSLDSSPTSLVLSLWTFCCFYIKFLKILFDIGCK